MSISMGNNDDGYHTTHLRVAGQPALTLMRMEKNEVSRSDCLLLLHSSIYKVVNLYKFKTICHSWYVFSLSDRDL
jgi:hypothetical protein